MDKYYFLGNVILRREYFGCIVCCFDTNLYHQLNQDAADILFFVKPKIPISFQALYEELVKKEFEIEKNELSSFLDSMIELCVIQQLASNNALPEYSKQKVFDDLRVIKEDRLTAPTSVSIHITQFCPKECKHCVTDSSPRINRCNELTTEQWFEVLEKLKAFGCTSLVFTGGDCFARKDIVSILKQADDLGFLLAVLSDYDGMQRQRLDEISKLKHLVEFQISLDGAKPETHDWMRGEGSYKRSLKRMEKLGGLKIPYTVSSVIHKNNLSEVEEIAEICQQYKAYNLYLAPLCPYGRGKYLTDILLNEDELWKLGQKYLKLIRDCKANPGNPFWNENLDKIGDKSFKPYNLSLDAVSTGYFNLSIDWKGDCFLDTKFRSQNILRFGNVLVDSIEDIWNSNELDDIRKLSDPKSVYVHQPSAISQIEKHLILE